MRPLGALRDAPRIHDVPEEAEVGEVELHENRSQGELVFCIPRLRQSRRVSAGMADCA
jgi:hypothetical protein